MQRDYILMIDTETANTITDENGQLDMRYVLPYDLGLAVIDRKGRFYETDSMVIRDVFCVERVLMQSAYYAKKIPQYVDDLRSGKRRMVSAYEAQQRVRELIKKYNIKHICAHNARFDVRALNNLVRWTTKSRYRFFLPYGIEVWDTMKMAQDTICQQKAYIQYCIDHGYITMNFTVRKTAEILYRYITFQPSFKESHTGLEDVIIETAILAHCFRQHKKMRRGAYED